MYYVDGVLLFVYFDFGVDIVFEFGCCFFDGFVEVVYEEVVWEVEVGVFLVVVV